MEIDAEFKFAKIQNSYVEGGWGGSQKLMLSPNLLKSKIPMSSGGGGGLRKLMLSPNLLKNELSFWAKCITVLFWTLSTKWFPYTKYR